MTSNAIADRWQCEYAKSLRKLAEKGVPRGRSDEALLDIVRISLQIARDAFKRLEGRRTDIHQ
ncbi:MAG: hypothetical protein P8R42_20990 [Candidatus Binatia bacterium]|nr:hypothetical protein [Candidatus Binatia bacterium]